MMAMGTYGEHAVDGDEENKQPYFIKNVGSEDLGLTTDEEKKEAEEATESNAELFGIMQEAENRHRSLSNRRKSVISLPSSDII